MDYLTIKEASEVTGKSAITIRRLIKKALQDPGTDVIQKVEQGGGFIYKISRDYLLGDHSPTQPSTQTTTQDDQGLSNHTSTQDGTIIEVVKLLQKQLEEKDKQINNLMDISKKNTELIYSLNAQVYQLTSGNPPPVSPQEVKEYIPDVKTKTDKQPIKKVKRVVKRSPVNVSKRVKKPTTQRGNHLTTQKSKLSTQVSKQVSNQKNRQMIRGRDGKFKRRGLLKRLFGI